MKCLISCDCPWLIRNGNCCPRLIFANFFPCKAEVNRQHKLQVGPLAQRCFESCQHGRRQHHRFISWGLDPMTGPRFFFCRWYVLICFNICKPPRQCKITRFMASRQFKTGHCNMPFFWRWTLGIMAGLVQLFLGGLHPAGHCNWLLDFHHGQVFARTSI